MGVSTASLLEWNLSLIDVVWSFGTLLGCEESHPLPWGPLVGVVGLPPSSEARVSVWWVLVGVVVDSWIVDASIL